MGRQEKVRQAKRIYRTSDFRGLESIKKGLKLIKDHGYELTIAASAAEVSRGAMRRALAAEGRNREIGRNGRPPLFNDEENIQLIEHLRNLSSDIRLTYSELQNQFLSFWKSQPRNQKASKSPCFSREFISQWIKKNDFKKIINSTNLVTNSIDDNLLTSNV